VRSKEHRTSSCARAIRGDVGCGGARAAPRVVFERDGMSTRSVPAGLREPGDPRSGHQGGDGDLHDRHSPRTPDHLGDGSGAARATASFHRLDEQTTRRGARTAAPDAPPRNPPRAHEKPLFGVPFERTPFWGATRPSSSILRASSKSLSVDATAAWFCSFTITRPQVTERSGVMVWPLRRRSRSRSRASSVVGQPPSCSCGESSRPRTTSPGSPSASPRSAHRSRSVLSLP